MKTRIVVGQASRLFPSFTKSATGWKPVLFWLTLSTLNPQLSTAHAQGTAFTYQGRLNDSGGPANGTYDFRFRLASDPLANNYVGSAYLTNGIAVSNGLFVTTMDFGPDIFTGSNYWLEVDVRTNNGGSYTVLNPLQAVTPTPYAIFAANVGGGGLAAGAYGNAVTFNNAGNSFSGSFSGNGGNVTNVNAAALNGLGAGNFWQTAGNAGTTAGVNFAGTTDNQPLELRVDNQRALRLEPDTTTNNSPNLIGGSPFNSAAPGVYGAAIGGGGGAGSANNQVLGDFNTIGGGWGNVTGSTNGIVFQATVGGGANNVASGISSTIAGGSANLAYNNDAAIAGGFQNRAGFRAAVAGGNLNTADGDYSGVGGGYGNDVATNAFIGYIGGGDGNLVTGAWAVIAGGYYNTNAGLVSYIGAGDHNIVQPGASYSVIGGGVLNQIFGDLHNTGHSVIAGGQVNIIFPNADYSVIGGGLYNQIYGDTNDFGTGVIAGGDANVINSNSWNSFIGGGQQNTIGNSSDHAGIGGGQFNSIQSACANATISGGYGNTIQTGANESVIAGGLQNTIGSNAVASTIGGGSDNIIQTNASYSAISGGQVNSIQTNAIDSVISGGYQNFIGINNGGSTIGGGFLNQIQSFTYYPAISAHTIAGGQNNIIQSNTLWATIGGGLDNTNGGYGATIPGGYANVTGGEYSFAAGNRAQALYSGDFVWADSQNTNFAATASDQVSFRCLGGVVFTSGSGAANQTVAWTPGSASWSFSSDRNLKDRFAAVDAVSVLDRVAQLPIVEWSYKGYSQRHIGAMAQDFHALFPLNNDDKSLNDADLHGVELAAIQGLNEKVEVRSQKSERQIEELKAENAALEARLERLEQLIVQKKGGAQ